MIMVTLNDNKVDKSEVFAEGWMENERAWGRPVALLVLPDGSLLISDDTADVVYRVTYRGRKSTQASAGKSATVVESASQSAQRLGLSQPRRLLPGPASGALAATCQHLQRT